MAWIQYTDNTILIIDEFSNVVAELPGNATSSEVASVFNIWLASLPQPPEPNWEQFKLTALNSETLTAILLAAQAIKPQCPGWLYVGLAKAENGNINDFALAWNAIVQSANVPTEVIEGFVSVAQACHLPADFVAALQLQENY